MSESPDEDSSNSKAARKSKKRLVHRACDTCRRKKIRCDGSQMPDNECTNCIAYTLECTYVEDAQKRGHSKGYVEELENRLEKMEKHLTEMNDRLAREASKNGSMGTLARHDANAKTPSSHGGRNIPIEDISPSDDEKTPDLSQMLKSMTLDSSHITFIGKSSGYSLVCDAIALKKKVTGTNEAFHFSRLAGPGWYPWEFVGNPIHQPAFIFPDEDLGMKLVDLFFVHVNLITPFLHRPSFERKIRDHLHVRNYSFGSVYLLVCAVASRYSDDPRVLDHRSGEVSELSAGWRFFQQVELIRKTLFEPPSLEVFQSLCGTSPLRACWTLIGTAVRVAQDVGAHRRKSYGDRPSVEGELWKRAFWVLVILDRHMSSVLGRSNAIQEEDLDLDYPIECDEEYWEHPDPQQAFKQPPGKPSTASFIISFIKLYNIVSFAQRTLYSVNKSKVLLGFVGKDWEQHIVAELDSSLNKWVEEIPDHLRWDPTRDTSTPFMVQSSVLYGSYYRVRILVHKAFLPSPRKTSPQSSFPSVEICTTAARSCSRVIDTFSKRVGGFAVFLQMPAVAAALILLTNLLRDEVHGLSVDPSKDMADARNCMDFLSNAERRWNWVGLQTDILYHLASAKDSSHSTESTTSRERKRQMNNDDDSTPVLGLVEEPRILVPGTQPSTLPHWMEPYPYQSSVYSHIGPEQVPLGGEPGTYPFVAAPPSSAPADHILPSASETVHMPSINNWFPSSSSSSSRSTTTGTLEDVNLNGLASLALRGHSGQEQARTAATTDGDANAFDPFLQQLEYMSPYAAGPSSAQQHVHGGSGGGHLGGTGTPSSSGMARPPRDVYVHHVDTTSVLGSRGRPIGADSGGSLSGALGGLGGTSTTTDGMATRSSVGAPSNFRPNEQWGALHSASMPQGIAEQSGMMRPSGYYGQQRRY